MARVGMQHGASRRLQGRSRFIIVLHHLGTLLPGSEQLLFPAPRPVTCLLEIAIARVSPGMRGRHPPATNDLPSAAW